MLFTITGKHMEVTEAIRTHAQEKVEKFPRYFDSITQVEVIVDGNIGGVPGVEIIARGEHGVVFVATESGEDLYASIDVAAHKLERQIRRKKQKQRNNKHIQSVAGEVLGEEDEREDVA